MFKKSSSKLLRIEDLELLEVWDLPAHPADREFGI